MNDYVPIEWVRTGIPVIDLIVGSGIPRGRFIEVIGDPATAKSVFGFIMSAAFQRAGGIAIYLDSEAKVDRPFAELFGVDFESLGYTASVNLDQAVQMIGRVAKTADPKVPTIIVWDSIAATPGAEELDDALEKGIESEKAKRARFLSSAFRVVLAELAAKKVTLLGINQLRTKMDFRSGYTSLDSPGGRAIKYHAGLRLHFRSRQKIRNIASDVVEGQKIEVEAVKNTVAPPFRKAVMNFRFDSGFEVYSGLAELLIRHGRIESSGGWLSYKGRKFRSAEIDHIVTEMPELLLPISGVAEKPITAPED